MTVTDADLVRYLRNWQGEVDSAAQYRAMAASEPQSELAKVYEGLAQIEERHAAFWETRLRDAGSDPGPRKPSIRARILIWSARRWGAQAVLPTVASREYVERDQYLTQRETEATGMTHEERGHARLLRTILAKTRGIEGSTLGRIEGRHRLIGGNALRAAVLGANDGLCSNLSLVMGVAGAAVATRTVLLTGIAGLLAGACSMALGEWVSVTSARELAERELGIERDEIETDPEEEREELELIFEAKGVPKSEAVELAAKLMKDTKTALEALAREELGIDPNELGGSPWVAGASSMALFALGAFIPVFPFLLFDGQTAVFASVAAGAAGLFLIGAGISIFTARSAWLSGARQLLLGLAAAGVTFAIGKLMSVTVGG